LPTGYTADINESTTFEQFAMRCARAFDACVTMRDKPMDAPIPDKFEPSLHYADALARAKAEYSRVSQLSPEQCEQEIKEIEVLQNSQAEKTNAARDNLRRLYDGLMEQVRAWRPPTLQHRDLRDFMIEQLNSSKKVDCWPAQPLGNSALSVEEWKKLRLESLKKDIDYYSKLESDDITRARERTEWISALRDSLAKPALTA
jgi:hypothetical protein